MPADRLSNADFGQAVETAVANAAKRNKLTDLRTALGSDLHYTPWWIVGRQVRDVDLGQAKKFAEAVTAEVSKRSGFDLLPTMTVVDGDILVGFIERFGNDIRVPGRFGGGPQI